MPITTTPVIPETVTVHLGPPGSDAENVTVPFTDYIKNVVSGEIYPTWPDSALEANAYAIISYVLNRIYTEHYRTRGYDYDITNDTRYDQTFDPNREVYGNISDIVDRIFNSYLVKGDSILPFFSQFCNGTTSVCPGLSQWGTVGLAEQGLTPLQILQSFYGDDLRIVTDAPVANITESYPGSPLELGDSGNEVKVIQTELNRIRQNYPAIPEIPEENGIFTVDTARAVAKFQEIFFLPVTGNVNRETWYRIKQIYNGVKRFSELVSEGLRLEEALLPFSMILTPGMEGNGVLALQYYLDVIAYFNPALEPVPVTGVFDAATEAAVRDFQAFYGLPVTGTVAFDTWDMLGRIYAETVAGLPAGYEGEGARLYPGFYLSEGMRGENVAALQTYLSRVAAVIPEIPVVPVTGYYGTQTRDAVYTFQRLFGLPITGTAGPLTWNTLANEYNALVGANTAV